MRAVLALLLLTACPPPEDTPSPDDSEPSPQDTAPPYEDADGDGWSPELGDCDDQDAAVHPGQPETCNGGDDNCNGMVDEGYGDADQDRVADCVDPEECDGLDNDGDGLADEDFGDADADGTADCVDAEACDGLDNDGDGEVDEGFDADGDGFLPCDPGPVDCDDVDPAVHPEAAEEEGNGRDDDCDGLIDEDAFAEGALVITEVMVNPQGASDPLGEWVEVLNAGATAVHLAGLTLDGGPSGTVVLLACAGAAPVAPGAYAVLAASADLGENGGIEVDCAAGPLGLSNEAGELTLRAADLVFDRVAWDDGASMPDVAGSSLNLDPLCTDAAANDDPGCWCAAPAGWTVRSDHGSPGGANDLCSSFDHDGDGASADEGDCDDADATVHPGAGDPWYDGLDQDCDGWSDFDADRDGYDSLDWGGTDCADADPAISPGLPEVCDEDDVDEDCNGLSDDLDPAPTGTGDFHLDMDRDGWGDEIVTTTFCDPPPWALVRAGDCDDGDPVVSPDGTEVCGDAVDDDCDGSAQSCAELSLAGADLALLGAAGDTAGAALAGLGATAAGPGIAVGLSASGGAGAVCIVADPVALAIADPDGRVDLASVAACFSGENAGDLAGGALAGGRDVDGDGYGDLLVGASGAGGGDGAAYLLLGAGPASGLLADADAVLTGIAAGDAAGWALAFAGDVDGDGSGDLLVGAPAADLSAREADAGEAYLFLGPILGTASLASADARLFGEARDAAGGASVAGGDLDGDGLADFVVGAEGDSERATEAGAVYVFTNRPSGSGSLKAADAKLIGEATSDGAGCAVAVVGDSDGDGLEDVLIGAWGESTTGVEAGAAYLVSTLPSGVTPLSRADAKLTGSALGDQAGTSVAAAGDVDGDGFADFLVGAPNAQTAAYRAGEAYLLLGPVSGTLDLVTEHDGWFLGEAREALAGTAVAGAGDLDADGSYDLLVSAPSLDGAGAAYVLLAGSLFP